jgi:hypothetical protein
VWVEGGLTEVKVYVLTLQLAKKLPVSYRVTENMVSTQRGEKHRYTNTVHAKIISFKLKPPF